MPITVETVADVQFGPRLRRGAASQDGKGEVVVGVAMMLLGENSRTVTEAVKAKIAAIGPSLPEGTRIEPFYDRSVLVNRTIRTVVKNLAEGALLVIGILFLLLGNLRASADLFDLATADRLTRRLTRALGATSPARGRGDSSH